MSKKKVDLNEKECTFLKDMTRQYIAHREAQRKVGFKVNDDEMDMVRGLLAKIEKACS